MTAIIIGANGQDGFYLNQLLLNKGIKVVGVSRSGEFLRTDITDFNAVKDLLELHQPDYIFHLAANSTTGHHAIFDNHNAISTGVINILEASLRVSPKSKIFLSGSGLQFVNKNVPIKETDEFVASSAYAVARIHSVYAGRYYRSQGLKVYVGYFFNHESPRRTPRHVSKMIGEAVKRIRDGSREKIEIGDLTVEKEWTFAGDIVNGVMALIEQDTVFESVIGSGLGYSIEQYVTLCFEHINKDWKEFVVEKNNFKSEYRKLISDASTLYSIGWHPEYTLSDLAKMMVSQ